MLPLSGVAQEDPTPMEPWLREMLEASAASQTAGPAPASLEGSSTSSLETASTGTGSRVRLYLIDTAVKHTSTWFAKNTKLSFKGTTRIYSSPTSSRCFTHGTRMLGVIAGPETGAALGTPIDVVNYDVYPGVEGSATTSSLVASAVNKAKIHYLTTSPKIPSVICIASGSTSPESDAALKYYIESAVAANITVVVSAGNQGINASNCIPAAYGTKEGIICVGADGKNGLPLPNSNYGAAVDLQAPGDDVKTLRYANPQPGTYDLMDGTSPAAGLVTATALVALSKNPSLTPAQVEQLLTIGTYDDASAPQAQVVTAEADADGDGASDILEAFFGCDPASASCKPAAPALTLANGQASLSFKVAAILFNPQQPRVLGNGGGWSLQISDDLVHWHDIEAEVTSGAEENGLVPVKASIPASGGTRFLRVEVKETAVSE